MLKVRILDRGEFCDGEMLICEARRLTAIDLAKRAMGAVIKSCPIQGREAASPAARC